MEGEAKGSNQETNPEAQPAERPGSRKGKDAKHPTGRKTEMLGSGTAKATPAAPATTQTRREGQGEALEIFRYTSTPEGFPHIQRPGKWILRNVRNWQSSNTPPPQDSQTNKKA
jgi:hypothetical protein